MGGWSKELVLATVADETGGVGARGWVVLAALVVTVVLTATYATRAALILLTPRPPVASPTPDEDLSTGELRAVEATRSAQREALRLADAAPLSTRVVIAALTLATAGGGVLLLAFERLLGVEAHVSLLWLTTTLVLALVGVALAWVLGGRGGDLAARLGTRQARWDGGFGADRLYLAAVAAPVLALARGVAALDERVVDAPVRALARGAVRLSDRVGERHTPAPLGGVALVGVGVLVLLAVAVTVALTGGRT